MKLLLKNKSLFDSITISPRNRNRNSPCFKIGSTPTSMRFQNIYSTKSSIKDEFNFIDFKSDAPNLIAMLPLLEKQK